MDARAGQQAPFLHCSTGFRTGASSLRMPDSRDAGRGGPITLLSDLKHGEFSEAEGRTVTRLHAVVGNRWSLIAAQLPGRTDNDVKDYWNTKLKRKLSRMGIYPDEMLHLLPTIEPPPGGITYSPYKTAGMRDETEDNTEEKIKLGLSRAIQEHNGTIVPVPASKTWVDPAGMGLSSSGNLIRSCSSFPKPEFHYGPTRFTNEEGSPWNRRLCGKSRLNRRLREESEGGKDDECNGSNSLFNLNCVLRDLLADDLMNPIVWSRLDVME
ncbi:hypothetical protein CDL15_Pgr007144 [Punica granatum]|uniref:Uncharacterized protein n=1 Tax=Punica granatum TaxID=22663 RepID=A0A218X848_PUNGR|nr:hypothetical protein CDL15_Pgr007144 [Punica granatum]